MMREIPGGPQESLFTERVGDGACTKSLRKYVMQIMSRQYVTCHLGKAVFVKHSAVLYYEAFHPENCAATRARTLAVQISPRGSTTMTQRTRREFLRDVGTGAVVASVGSGLAADLGFSSAFADQGPERLTFGSLEPLVSLMQETPAARLIPLVVERLRQGTALCDITAAAALANARTFGGEDYVGFHTMMAMAPAF